MGPCCENVWAKLQGCRSIGRKLFINFFFTSLAILKWLSPNRERRRFGEIVNSSFRYLLEAKIDAIALHPVRHCFSIKFGKTWKLKYPFSCFLLCFATKRKGCSYGIALQRSPRNKSTHQRCFCTKRPWQAPGSTKVFPWCFGFLASLGGYGYLKVLAVFLCVSRRIPE